MNVFGCLLHPKTYRFTKQSIIISISFGFQFKSILQFNIILIQATGSGFDSSIPQQIVFYYFTRSTIRLLYQTISKCKIQKFNHQPVWYNSKIQRARISMGQKGPFHPFVRQVSGCRFFWATIFNPWDRFKIWTVV